MENQATMLFVESWENQKLHWDDVEFPNGSDVSDQHRNLLQQFFSQNEETENDLSVMDSNNPLFNSSYANRLKQKNQRLNWKDVDLVAFQNIRGKNSNKFIQDQTILKKPNLAQVYDPDLDLLPRSNKHTSADSINRTFNDIGNLHQSSINEETNSDRDNEFNDMNIDMAIGNFRNITNPDVSRSLSHQFTTPIISNRVHLQTFPSSTHRTLSQQKRHPSDVNNSRNINYYTPRHDNIR
jgi:hypothetical protein